MKKQLEDFLSTYKLQKGYLDKNDNYTMDGKNFIDWYINESGNVVKKLNIADVSKSFYCETKRGCLEQCDDCALTELAKDMAC